MTWRLLATAALVFCTTWLALDELTDDTPLPAEGTAS